MDHLQGDFAKLLKNDYYNDLEKIHKVWESAISHNKKFFHCNEFDLNSSKNRCQSPDIIPQRNQS